jgi:hypothetical protein
MLNEIGVAFDCTEYDVAAKAVAERKVDDSARRVRLENICEVGDVLFDSVLPTDFA